MRTMPFVDLVVVVDDGSIDNTAGEARKNGAEVLSLEENTGKANATKVGFRSCTDYNAVVTLDGDLQHCPEEIPILLDEVKKGADLCIGSRFLNGHVSMPLGNWMSNRVASRIISAISGRRISDPQSGFRALDGSALSRLELRAEKYAIEHVMILEAAKKGLTIREVPINCVYGDEVSQIRVFSDTLRVAYDILRFIVR